MKPSARSARLCVFRRHLSVLQQDMSDSDEEEKSDSSDSDEDDETSGSSDSDDDDDEVTRRTQRKIFSLRTETSQLETFTF